VKIKHCLITLAAFAVAAFTTTLHASGLPAPMPEFLSQEQLVKWQADRITAAESKMTAAREQAAIQFYTGKPFDSSSGSYLFKYRSYNPEISRWTSADASGFPDGSNNWLYGANIAVHVLDPDVLDFLHFDGSSITVYDGSGHQAGGNVDWGNTGQSWAATSGGTGGAPCAPDGWYRTYGPMTLGGVNLSQPRWPEKSIQEGNILFAGTMSSWDRNSGTGYGGYNASWSNNRGGYDTASGGIAPNIVEYKIGLAGIHGNNVSPNAGFRIHPTMAGSTIGCVGITSYADAVSFQSYINSNIGISC